MNYLSHYFLDRAAPDPAFVVGLVLPDIAKRAGVRLRAGMIGGTLGAGIDRHLAVDAAFHNSAYFQRKNRQFFEALAALPLRAEVRYRNFMGHLALEMLLDRRLLADHPTLDAEFYDRLAAFPPAALRDQLGQSDVLTAAGAGAVAAQYERFLVARFLRHYHDRPRLTRQWLDVYAYVTRCDPHPDADQLAAFLTGAEYQLADYSVGIDETRQRLAPVTPE